MPSTCCPDEILDHTTRRALMVVDGGVAGPARIRRDRPLRCRRCGEAVVADWAAVISSHRSGSGTVAYVRCPCGAVGVVAKGPPTA
jgi:hypothetical protein